MSETDRPGAGADAGGPASAGAESSPTGSWRPAAEASPNGGGTTWAAPDLGGPSPSFQPAPPPRLSQQTAGRAGSAGGTQQPRPPAFIRALGTPAGHAAQPPAPYPPSAYRVTGYPASPASGFPAPGFPASGFPHPGFPALPASGLPAAHPPRDAWPMPVRPPAWLATPAFPRSADRPKYREPHPVRGARVALGVSLGTLWMILFGLFAGSARAYAWLTLAAGVLAWLTAATLCRFGDRGTAVGAAIAAGAGVAAAALVVALRLANNGEWILW